MFRLIAILIRLDAANIDNFLNIQLKKQLFYCISNQNGYKSLIIKKSIRRQPLSVFCIASFIGTSSTTKCLLSNSCPSVQMFASGFFQIPPRNEHPSLYLDTSRYKGALGTSTL